MVHGLKSRFELDADPDRVGPDLGARFSGMMNRGKPAFGQGISASWALFEWVLELFVALEVKFSMVHGLKLRFE